MSKSCVKRSIVALTCVAGAASSAAGANRPLIELASLQPMPPERQGAFGFTDVTVASGIAYLQHGFTEGGEKQYYWTGGAACADFNGDGWTDIYATCLDGPDLLFQNNGDGTFTDVAATALGPNYVTMTTNGVQAGDIDNDGDVDLYVTASAVNRYYLYVNDGNGNFTEEAVARGVDMTSADTHYGQSTCFGDYDKDGWIDIYTTEWRLDSDNPDGALQNSRLYRNMGAANPGHYTEETYNAGVAMDGILSNNPPVFDSMSFAPRFVDMDRDGHVDLIVASDHQTSTLWWNNGDGTFTNGTATANVGTDSFGMGSTVGDYDGDGDLDWFVTSIYDDFLPTTPPRDGNRLYQNNGDRTFTDVTDVAGVREGYWGWGAVFADLDNDGDLDLPHTNGVDFKPPHFNRFSHEAFVNDPTRLFMNNGDGTFSEQSAALGMTDDASGKGIMTFDYDKDGDLDVLITNCGGLPVLYRNDGGNANNWLRVNTTGTVSNRDGYNAFVTVTPDAAAPGDVLIKEIDGGSNFMGQDEKIAHFGLGSETVVDEVFIEWPSGNGQRFTAVAANQVIEAVEPTANNWMADVNGDGSTSPADFTAWLVCFNNPAAAPYCGNADVNQSGTIDPADFTAWLAAFNTP